MDGDGIDFQQVVFFKVQVSSAEGGMDKMQRLWLRRTVDGRNPAPVEVGSLSQYLQGFDTSLVVIGGFLNHQQKGENFPK